MKRAVFLIFLLATLAGSIVFKDSLGGLSHGFPNLEREAKNLAARFFEEEIKKPVSEAIDKKIDETIEKVKEAITQTAEEAVGQIVKSPPLIKPVAAPLALDELSKTGIYTWTAVERTKAGLPVLLPSFKLDRIGEARLKDMFLKQYFEHVSPSGESASTLADQIGYEYIAIGENIARGGFESDRALVQAWMASPGHRANILSSKFTEIGLAVSTGTFEGQTTWIAVQIFGKPLSACPATNEELKGKIDSDKTHLGELEKRALSIKSELESRDPQTQDGVRAYNQKVEEYNTLVKEINALISEIKGEIQTYNQGVELFNLCAASGGI